ncbi:hypothetical protein ABEKA_0402 [Acinetobacter lwoffii]|nr:hypothetical protein ABEKA_0402 [Acinetobacter lwoffii]
MPRFDENRLSFKRIFDIKRPLNDFNPFIFDWPYRFAVG